MPDEKLWVVEGMLILITYNEFDYIKSIIYLLL